MPAGSMKTCQVLEVWVRCSLCDVACAMWLMLSHSLGTCSISQTLACHCSEQHTYTQRTAGLHVLSELVVSLQQVWHCQRQEHCSMLQSWTHANCCAFRWHNRRFYAVLDDTSAETVLGPAISMNTGILGLPVKDANTFHDNLMVSSANTPHTAQSQCQWDTSCSAMCHHSVLRNKYNVNFPH